MGTTPNSQTAFVDTDNLAVYPNNGNIHFMAEAQVVIGESCAAAMLALEANDADRDGVLLSDEITLGTGVGVTDSDGDSQTDGFERAAGTDPLDPFSFFQITSTELLENEFIVEWPSAPGNLYQVEVSTNLVDWLVIDNAFSATEGNTTEWITAIDNVTNTFSTVSNDFVLYDGGSGVDGNFDTDSFDSSDINPISDALRMTQGSSLTGGGAGRFILNTLSVVEEESITNDTGRAFFRVELLP